jgi:hypothetical protein
VRRPSRLRLRAESIPSLPPSVRAVLRNGVWAYGRATSRIRPLPDFLVIGAQKCGTTALYAYLRWHPHVTGPAWKEVSFFDRHYGRGESWYRGQFPSRPWLWLRGGRSGQRPLVGEASPSYVLHPYAPQRVRALLPDVRLVVLLRDPVDRAFSHYHHEVALGREPLSFEEALDREDERTAAELDRLGDTSYFSQPWWDFTYAARGRYAEQLRRWLEVFPRDRLLVLASEQLRLEPARAYADVLAFIGADPFELAEYPPIFEREYAPMHPDTRARLERYFAPHNDDLYALLGEDLGWSRPR